MEVYSYTAKGSTTSCPNSSVLPWFAILWIQVSVVVLLPSVQEHSRTPLSCATRANRGGVIRQTQSVVVLNYWSLGKVILASNLCRLRLKFTRVLSDSGQGVCMCIQYHHFSPDSEHSPTTSVVRSRWEGE